MPIQAAGPFPLSLGNLVLFEIMVLEFKEVAWVFWVFLQGVAAFDVDTHKRWHFVCLFFYIVLLLIFWGLVCHRHSLWLEASSLWIMTGLFSLTWFIIHRIS